MLLVFDVSSQGMIPLLFPDVPYTYSEGLESVVPDGYNVSDLPTQWCLGTIGRVHVLE